MVSREDAKKQLIAIGVAEPTDQQITDYLNNVNAEAVKEKAKADKYKTDAEKAAELQRKLDELEQNGLSDLEKERKAKEALEARVAELQANSFKSEAKAILKEINLEDADIEALLPGMVAGLDKLEDVQSRANAYVATVNKVRETAIKEHAKEALDNTGTPGGSSGGDEKAEDVKFAEEIAGAFGAGSKEAEDAFKNY